MHRLIHPVFLMLCCISLRPLGAQVTTVKVNLGARAFESATLPFSEPFFIRGPVPENVNQVQIRYGPRNPAGVMVSTAGVLTWKRDPGALARETEFLAIVAPLRPDLDYIFEFVLSGEKRDTPPTGQEFAISLRAEPAGGEPPASSYSGTIRENVQPPASPVVSSVTDTAVVWAETRSTLADRFDADIGLLMSSEAGYFGVVSSAHYYPFAPKNKNSDLADLAASEGFLRSMGRRVSIFGGLALQELSSSEDVDALFDIGSPVAGVGVRGFAYWPFMSNRLRPFLQPLRLNVGAIVFEQKDPNPLLDRKHRKTDFFVSLTADIEVKSLLGPLAAFF